MKRRQTGLTTVEFAIAGLAATFILLGCIEFGRLLFVMNAVGEATRRAAHIAAICPINDSKVAHAALIGAGEDDTTSPIVKGLEQSLVQVTYLTATGADTDLYAEAEFARVEVSGFEHTIWIPGGPTFDLPTFATTVAVESLGWIPEAEERLCVET